MLALCYDFQNLYLCKSWGVCNRSFRWRPLFSEDQALVPAQDCTGLAYAHRRFLPLLGLPCVRVRVCVCPCSVFQAGISVTSLYLSLEILPKGTPTEQKNCNKAHFLSGVAQLWDRPRYGPSFATGNCCTDINSTFLCSSPASKPQGDGKMGNFPTNDDALELAGYYHFICQFSEI